MNIRSVTYEQLTKAEVEAWSEIQRTEPLLASPYFRPEFSQAVAAVRNDVEIAVIDGRDRPLGFLPFQRSRWNTGRPVGGNLSDFHGLIAPRSISCDPLELLRACRLTAWHFDHLLTEQQFFSPFIWREADSPYIDLSEGMDAYLAQRKNGRSLMSEYGQKKRKLEREVGRLRFVAHVPDRQIISTFLAWKSARLRRMGVPNIFNFTWVRNLISKILEYGSEDFSPVVSVVYAGDNIAAIDIGMRSREVLHSWFPTYNIELARYSPGFLCWIETMLAAESLGIRRIDFGRGTEPFKYRLMSDAAKVAEGAADLRHGAAAVRRAYWHARDRIQMSPLSLPAHILAQRFHRMRHWLDTRIANEGKTT